MRAASRLATLQTSGVQVAIGPFLVHLRSELPRVHEYLDTLYADFAIGHASGSHFDIAVVGSAGVRRWIRPQANLIVNGVRPFLPLPGDLAGALFEWSLNWCVGRNAHRWVAMHAAVVERHGQAMILSAVSGSGKSTLCAALTLHGWRLLSDEFALLDPKSGRLSPLPRPISLKNQSIEIIGRREPGVVFGPAGVDIEGERFVHMKPPLDSVRRADETAAPSVVIFPRWVAGSATKLEPIPRAHALIRLTDQSFNYNFLGVEGFSAVATMVGAARCFTLEYSDLDEVLARLDRLTQN